jgi:putative transposase
MVNPENCDLSISLQCKLLEISRSGYYKPAKSESSYNMALMRLIDEEFTRHPFLGFPR